VRREVSEELRHTPAGVFLFCRVSTEKIRPPFITAKSDVDPQQQSVTSSRKKSQRDARIEVKKGKRKKEKKEASFEVEGAWCAEEAIFKASLSLLNSLHAFTVSSPSPTPHPLSLSPPTSSFSGFYTAPQFELCV